MAQRPKPHALSSRVCWAVLVLCSAMLGLVFSQRPPPNYSFNRLPDTEFSCRGRVVGGYYADVEAHCQMFHVCGSSQLTSFRFLCPNDTVFDQQHLICANWHQVRCDDAAVHYGRNFEIFKTGIEDEMEFNHIDDGDLPPLEDYDQNSALGVGRFFDGDDRLQPVTTTRRPFRAPSRNSIDSSSFDGGSQRGGRFNFRPSSPPVRSVGSRAGPQNVNSVQKFRQTKPPPTGRVELGEFASSSTTVHPSLLARIPASRQQQRFSPNGKPQTSFSGNSASFNFLPINNNLNQNEVVRHNSFSSGSTTFTEFPSFQTTTPAAVFLPSISPLENRLLGETGTSSGTDSNEISAVAGRFFSSTVVPQSREQQTNGLSEISRSRQEFIRNRKRPSQSEKSKEERVNLSGQPTIPAVGTLFSATVPTRAPATAPSRVLSSKAPAAFGRQGFGAGQRQSFAGSQTTQAPRRQSFAAPHTTSAPRRQSFVRSQTTQAPRRQSFAATQTTQAPRRQGFVGSQTTPAPRRQSFAGSQTTPAPRRQPSPRFNPRPTFPPNPVPIRNFQDAEAALTNAFLDYDTNLNDIRELEVTTKKPRTRTITRSRGTRKFNPRIPGGELRPLQFKRIQHSSSRSVSQNRPNNFQNIKKSINKVKINTAKIVKESRRNKSALVNNLPSPFSQQSERFRPASGSSPANPFQNQRTPPASSQRLQTVAPFQVQRLQPAPTKPPFNVRPENVQTTRTRLGPGNAINRPRTDFSFRPATTPAPKPTIPPTTTTEPPTTTTEVLRTTTTTPPSTTSQAPKFTQVISVTPVTPSEVRKTLLRFSGSTRRPSSSTPIIIRKRIRILSRPSRPPTVQQTSTPSEGSLRSTRRPPQRQRVIIGQPSSNADPFRQQESSNGRGRTGSFAVRRRPTGSPSFRRRVTKPPSRLRQSTNAPATRRPDVTEDLTAGFQRRTTRSPARRRPSSPSTPATPVSSRTVTTPSPTTSTVQVSTLPTNKEAPGLGRQNGFFVRPKLQLSSAVSSISRRQDKITSLASLARPINSLNRVFRSTTTPRPVSSTSRVSQSSSDFLSNILFASSSPGRRVRDPADADYDYQYYDSDFRLDHLDSIVEADSLFRSLNRKGSTVIG